MKKLFFDLETTGLLLNRHGVHQIAGIVEIDGRIESEFDFKVRPHEKAELDPEALRIGRVDAETVLAYEPIGKGYKRFIRMLSKHIDRFDRSDKFHLVGYNNRSFDDKFLRAWFEHNDDPYFGSWFWSDSMDVLVLASQYLQHRRSSMANFKLATVAKELGIAVDKDKFHDGLYDVQTTRAIYRIVTGIEMEI